MNGKDGHSLPSRDAATASGSFSTTSLTDDSSQTLATRQDARRRSFLDLDDDVFNYVCSYVPVNDLLHNVAVASHDTRRRVSANHALWQQLWMRYLLFFFNALIPATAAPTRGRWGVAPPDAMGMLYTTTTTPPSHDSVLHLYHFHHSAEAKPHVVQLEQLHIVREDIADPAAAASPTSRRAPSELRTAEVQAQLLSFAQACATQTVAQNLIYTAAPSSPSSASPQPSARAEGVPQGETFAHGGTLHVLKQQQRQANRLQRVLHFLLSTSGHRPRFHDRLWGATNDAERKFIRKARMGAASTDTKPAKRRNPLSPSSSHAAAAPHSSPARVRPLSWIDDQETSVKVLLFDDDTRSVGDAAAVQEERSKLLASIATNWRTAYASHFYPSVTSGSEPGSPLSRLPASNLPVFATAAATAGGEPAPPVPDAERSRREQQLNEGHVTWEQVYRRFRDGSSTTIRSTARMQQQAAAQRRDMGTDDEVDAAIPSSSNPLFDLHLLGYETRKQVYAAMLASTVEVPEGMGAFFGTCVSESFLRWWCWRNRRRTEASQAPVAPPASALGDDRGELPVRRHSALAPFAAACDDASPPRSLWVVRVAARNPRDDVGRGEAEDESVTYSSSFSDMSTTASNTSTYTLASSSIRFAGEREEENEFSTEENSSELETAHAVAADEEPHVAAAEASSPPQPPPTPFYHPPVAVLFPFPHMLTYWFMMHHVSFYSHQVYRRMWGDQELTIAVWSRILSPTGHSAECRLFYSLRCATFPRMFTKMMFTPGVLPSLTLQGKMAERSPYCSSSSSSACDSQSLSPDADGDAGSTPGSSPASTGDKPVDSRQIYDLFWTGFGRVEVDSGPTISRSNMLRLRIALGLPVNFPMGLLWNVVMFASGIGPLILKEHRHSLHFNYAKTFTDVVADEFGELACFGLGAQSPSRRNDSTAMANPLDAEAGMWGRLAVSAVAPAVGQEHVVRTTDNNRETPESDEQAAYELDPAHHDTSSAPTPLTGITNWSWDLGSEFSSDEAYWSLPGSDVSSGHQ
ncbi:conserved hypothetical protein [Leishmania major strain Friedlin]|uniref:F-box domain-containing protein n=1 Tax=Leishmania major TaxID=5664 RepID=Q4QFB5_LEIMA|nr:conserved hypothetical protein [Leishmania major strain Friedlin]CAG9571426.1 hypothetical_protein_-_conserved [Leishmania major strain Friedlin]CAJ03294.1 conserved hypothetical protein [Leishmania major strain Friedlin]|eukprot:XP_001681983.1 conserved hypothetical protein [Leishmania major strain Friedlin]